MKISKLLAAVALFALASVIVFAEMQPNNVGMYNRPTGVTCGMPDFTAPNLNPAMVNFVGAGIRTCNSMNKGKPVCILQCMKEVKRLGAVRHTKPQRSLMADCTLMADKDIAGLAISACLVKAHADCRTMSKGNIFCVSRCEKNALQRCRVAQRRY